MLKTLVNEVRFKLRVDTTGPLLIRSGHATVSGPDLTPVRTFRNGRQEVYLPGTSLKGVIRSHLEKVIRTLNPGVVCNPFVKASDSFTEKDGAPVCVNYADVCCGDKFELRKKGELRRQQKSFRLQNKSAIVNETAYRESCPACRLFGSTSFTGRVSIGDAYLAEGSRGLTENRNGVGIDRLTGGSVKRALFDLEAVSSGVTFEADLLLRNFECWQLGALLLVLKDMQEGFLRLGSGRSRGFGAVTGGTDEVLVSYVGPVQEKPAHEIWGLGRFAASVGYGPTADDVIELSMPTSDSRQGLRVVTRFVGRNLEELINKAGDVFVHRMTSWPTPPAMTWEYLQWIPTRRDAR